MVELKRSSIFSDDLTKSVSDLRNANDFIDVTLVSGDGKQFFAHRVILAASSPFFKMSNAVETKVEFVSEVDKKLLHIFQPEERSKHAVKKEETRDVVADLSLNSKWMERVQSQKKFCNLCDYVTNGNSKLKRHMEVKHDMERREPIVCKTTSCGESFKTSSGFKEHREKCFMTCPSNACNSKFTIPESLEIHRRKHELGEIKEHRFLLKKADNSEASLKRIWDGIQKTS